MKVYRYQLSEEEMTEDCDLCQCDECGSWFEEVWVIHPCQRTADGAHWFCNECIKLLREKIDRLRLLVI